MAGKTQSPVVKHEAQNQFHLNSPCNPSPWQMLLHFSSTFYISVRSFVVRTVKEKPSLLNNLYLKLSPSEQCDCPCCPVPLHTANTWSNLPMPPMLSKSLGISSLRCSRVTATEATVRMTPIYQRATEERLVIQLYLREVTNAIFHGKRVVFLH